MCSNITCRMCHICVTCISITISSPRSTVPALGARILCLRNPARILVNRDRCLLKQGAYMEVIRIADPASRGRVIAVSPFLQDDFES